MIKPPINPKKTEAPYHSTPATLLTPEVSQLLAALFPEDKTILLSGIAASFVMTPELVALIAQMRAKKTWEIIEAWLLIINTHFRSEFQFLISSNDHDHDHSGDDDIDNMSM